MACLQRAARRWMLQREKATSVLADPTWRPFVTQSGLPLWLCAATGDVATTEPPKVPDIRGGLVCYEPVRAPARLKAALPCCPYML